MKTSMVTTTIPALQCSRCGHRWVPKLYKVGGKEQPAQCPSCHSPYWNRERKRPKR